MSRGEQERLRDIQDAIAAIRKHLDQVGETTAAKEDPLLHDALLFQFVVIGEAIKNLTPGTRNSAPEIPWTDIAGLHQMVNDRGRSWSRMSRSLVTRPRPCSMAVA